MSDIHFERRCRDLVHGSVHLTATECAVIDHPYFQRLRYIRQNDAAFLVYPSLNVTRFEHSLGCCHVAGRIASAILQPNVDIVKQGLGFGPLEFHQLCRLYALLHDVGHLPLSHLFELGWGEYATREALSSEQLCTKWFGTTGFKAPHEALGSIIAPTILRQIPLDRDNGYTQPVSDAAIKLLTAKHLPHKDPLWLVKWMVDSEIDADRIDSTARDGMLAGGEYGSYDLDRLCSSFRLWKDDSGWRLGYSPRAVSSLEGLLLDRYRTHAFIHFHHAVISVKCAYRLLIAQLLKDFQSDFLRMIFTETGDKYEITRNICFFDDVWLLSMLRNSGETKWKQEPEASALRAALYRDKTRFVVVAKRRTDWTSMETDVRRRAGFRGPLNLADFGRAYERFLQDHIETDPLFKGLFVRIHTCPFRPLGDQMLPLCENRDTEPRHRDLLDVSPLCASLTDAWRREPQFYAVIFGDLAGERRRTLRELLIDWWIRATTAWLVSIKRFGVQPSERSGTDMRSIDKNKTAAKQPG